MTSADSDLISIVTPAYKAAATIRDTIRSVRAQTHSHWELLVAEDCGSDDTRAIVAVEAASDSRVRLIPMERNGGPAAARNHALAQARGRWVAFLDSDDLWLPQKLEKQLAFHRQRPGTVLTFTGFRRINADASLTGRYLGVPPLMRFRDVLGNTAIATSTVLVDTHFSGPIRMRDTYYDDFACWLDLLRGGGEAAGLDEDLARYRVMRGSVSRDKRNSALEVWRAYRQLQGLGRLPSAWYFANYAVRGWLKYRRF